MSTVDYHYLAPSFAGEDGIQLHTSAGRGTHPLLFTGFATDPLAASRGILTPADVASSDFAFRRPPSLPDPVVTAGEGRLRQHVAPVQGRVGRRPRGSPSCGAGGW
jgi:hypothetical protein